MSSKKKSGSLDEQKLVARLLRQMKKYVDTPRCGLCGATENLTKTECCDRWICDDEDQYVLFSYARNSCYRNHRRQTLCGFHHAEGHAGDWKDCPQCRDNFSKVEMYVWCGTNEYNFEELPNSPSYEPTQCDECNEIIDLTAGGYSIQGEKYRCKNCSDIQFPRRQGKGKASPGG